MELIFFNRDQGSDSVKRPESIKKHGSGGTLASAGLILSSPSFSEAERLRTLTNAHYANFHSTQSATTAKHKKPSALRRRTGSGSLSESGVWNGVTQPAPGHAPSVGPSGKAGAGVTIKLKPGVGALDQLRDALGEADFSGWMMKKGERYNTWKTRFFFLKGPHLYYLRSRTVGPLPVSGFWLWGS